MTLLPVFVLVAAGGALALAVIGVAWYGARQTATHSEMRARAEAFLATRAARR